MSRFNVMPRAYRRQLQATDQQAVDRAVRESAGTPEHQPTRHELTKPGDTRKLRGIPMYARGVAGVLPGTSPLGELMAKQPHD